MLTPTGTAHPDMLLRLVVHTLAGAAHDRRAVPPMASDAWLFTSVRADDPAPGSVLPALLEPLASPLWIGEQREIRIRDPRQYQLLASLTSVDESFVFVSGLQTRSLAGTVATEARLLALNGMQSATIFGVSGQRVLMQEGERPWHTVRCQKVVDKTDPSNATAIAALRQERTLAEAQWEQASELARLIAKRRLAATLGRLGGAASAAMLAIPMEDQLALRRASTQAGIPTSGGASSAGRSAAPSLDELLESGASLAAECVRAEAMLAGEVEAVPSDAPIDEGAAELRRLALASHVALRLATGHDEKVLAWGIQSGDCSARWERVIAALEAKTAALRVMAAMTAAATGDGAPNSSNDDAGRAGGAGGNTDGNAKREGPPGPFDGEADA